jgi:hypothetical protein
LLPSGPAQSGHPISIDTHFGISEQIILGKTFVEQQFHYSWLTTSDFARSSA